MKIILRTSLIAVGILLTLANTQQLYSDDQPKNVLSYFAAGNTIDGQLLAGERNLLRFFPIFALRTYMQAVTVNIYSGNRYFPLTAAPNKDSSYWEVSLPPFNLGEAIQRIEVKTDLQFDKSAPVVSKYRKRIDNRIGNRYFTFRKTYDSLLTSLTILRDSFYVDSVSKYLIKYINAKSQQINPPIVKVSDHNDCRLADLITQLISLKNHKAYIRYEKNTSCPCVNNVAQKNTTSVSYRPKNVLFREEVDSLVVNYQSKKEIHGIGNNIVPATENDPPVDSMVENLRTLRLKYHEIDSTIDLFKLNGTNMDLSSDSVREALFQEIGRELTDTNYSGIAVKKSDIIVHNTDSVEQPFKAQILYRNYKGALRQMPALDPAERQGIFRVRFVPFPIAGIPGDKSGKVGMRGIFANDTIAPSKFSVFEIGLGFGDLTEPGDEFVFPEFSPRRLGVAIAITEKLFAGDAQLIALALTYDFNSYGSIGFGQNFAQRELHPYFSLGINKKAFEVMLAGITNLFK